MEQHEYTIIDHLMQSGSYETRKLDIKLIKEFVLANKKLTITQQREVVMARRYLAYLISVKLGHTLRLAGEILGGRDHTTMVAAIKRHYEAIETKDPVYIDIKNSIQKDIEDFRNYGYQFN